MECGTAEVMSTEERCHTEGIKEGVGEEGKRGGEKSTETEGVMGGRRLQTAGIWRGEV